MTTTSSTVPLGEIVRRVKDAVLIDDLETYARLKIRLNGKGIVLRDRVLGQEIGTKRQFLARTGQLVLSKIDARNGAFGILAADCDRAIITGNFWAFNTDTTRLVPAYFDYLTRTPLFVEFCIRASEGTTNRRYLQEDSFLKQKIMLPPLEEQRRIVARIEELAAKINEARALRQKALDETAALLDVSRRGFFSSCSAETVELQEICSEIIDNLHSNPQYSDSGIPCVRSPDVGYGTLNLDGALRTDEDEYRRRTIRGEPKPNDVVLVREGGGTGKCALVLPEQRFSLGQRVMMLRPNREQIVPKFFLHQLLSPLVQEEQIAPLSKGSASPHLNIGAVKKFSVRLPSLPEQERIVTELDALQSQVDALKKLQAETAGELNALMTSILDKAFKGEL